MEKSDLELRIEDFSSEVSKTENPGLIGKWDRIKLGGWCSLVRSIPVGYKKNFSEISEEIESRLYE